VNKTAELQMPHNLQRAFCFMLIHVQLQLPVVREQTKTSYDLLTHTQEENFI